VVAENYGGKIFTATFNADVLCVCADSCVIFSTEPYCTLFWRISPFALIVAPDKYGQGFQICEKNLPPTHRSRDAAHAHWLQTYRQWYPMGDVRTHKSRTDIHRICKLGGGIDHVTRHV